MFQGVFDLVLIVAVILFLRWLYHKWFSKEERKRSSDLVSKKVALKELRRKRADLGEAAAVTKEAMALQGEIDQIAREVEVIELIQRKEDLGETTEVTEEALNLQKEIKRKEKALKDLKEE